LITGDRMRNLKITVLVLIIFLNASFSTMGFSHPGHGSYGVSETTHNFLYHAIFSWIGLLFLVIAVALMLALNKKLK